MGTPAAKSLAKYIDGKAEIIVLQDTLSDGPLHDGDYPQHDTMRSRYLSSLAGKDIVVADLATVLRLSTLLNNNVRAQATIWMGSTVSDTIAYYFLLHYLAKHLGRISLVNMANLPFLDDDKKLFFPESIAALNVTELAKAQKLSRVLNAVDLELDGGKYAALKAENAAIRIRVTGGNILSQEESYYDGQLQKILEGNVQVAAALRKMNADVSLDFLKKRLSILS